MLDRIGPLIPTGEIAGAPDTADLGAAAEELERLQKRLRREKRRQCKPPWAWPVEHAIAPLNPRCTIRPGPAQSGI
eukprot:1786406-Pyramimonas_sp.AAC.1